MKAAKSQLSSDIRRKVNDGHYIRNAQFRGYGNDDEVDRPSWDKRASRHAKMQRQARSN